MPKDSILFERSDIVIRERSAQSEIQATPLDQITGTITLIENVHGKFFRFIPLELEDVMTDDWAFINGGHSVVSHNNNNDNNQGFIIIFC